MIALFTVYFVVRMILRPLEARAMTTATAPQPRGGGLSRRSKIFIGIGLYLLIGIVLYVLLGDEGKNEEFKPQNEFKLDNWISLEIGPFDMSINKAVLYLFMGSALTIAAWMYIANRMQARPNRVQTAVETLYQLMKNNITEGNMDTPHGEAVVHPDRDPLPLHLVREPDRLHPAPDEHRAQGRHLRARRSHRWRCTRRPRTSRYR